MSGLDDRHDGQVVVDLVEDPQISLSNAVLLLATELLEPRWARVTGESPDTSDDSSALLQR
jgi:hypothetical protein